MDQRIDLISSLLDHTHGRLLQGDVAEAIRHLIDRLREHRLAVSKEVWDRDVKPVCLGHAVRRLLHQDPYTLRAFEKPRGYAGDAVMLDYVYSRVAPAETTPLGRQVFESTTGGPNGRSVVARRDILSELIDEVAVVTARPRILSVACGHLREAQHSAAVREGRVGEFIALDQDRESLAVVEREQGGHGVTTLHASVRSLLSKNVSFTGLNLVYASGLYDYLSDATATRLTGIMFAMLTSGGKLLIANYSPDSHGRGYMEGFMDWRLTYRGEEEMVELGGDIPGEAVRSKRVFRDPLRNIVFLEITRV
jgi:extracellular factor (EF) 3-hydroxypalmitic acid methyl ester biosynthesis protein